MKKIIILLALVMLNGCSLEEDCLDYTPPPPAFVFQFIDKNTGDDLFITKKAVANNVKVVDEKGVPVKFNISEQADRAVVILNSIGWNLEKKQYTITLNEKISVKFLLKMKSVEHRCYTSFKVETFKIENYEYKQENQTGIIQVKI